MQIDDPSMGTKDKNAMNSTRSCSVKALTYLLYSSRKWLNKSQAQLYTLYKLGL